MKSLQICCIPRAAALANERTAFGTAFTVVRLARSPRSCVLPIAVNVQPSIRTVRRGSSSSSSQRSRRICRRITLVRVRACLYLCVCVRVPVRVRASVLCLDRLSRLSLCLSRARHKKKQHKHKQTRIKPETKFGNNSQHVSVWPILTTVCSLQLRIHSYKLIITVIAAVRGRQSSRAANEML